MDPSTQPETKENDPTSPQPEPGKESQAEKKQEQTKHSPGKLTWLSLTALGVVYGDIGTSPLYALRECFAHEGMYPTHPNVLGVLSLILWSLIVVISIKYLIYVMRADNDGEGGILALASLLNPWRGARRGKARIFVIVLGVFGAALLYGDGMITPAISVLSAVEGLKTATPVFTPYVIPITIVILIALFTLQKQGTKLVGSVFGPVMLLWFSVLALLGIGGIVQNPAVLAAVSPHYAVLFFIDNGWIGFTVLGSVFLVVTGGEALYADLGHFGAAPIRLAWFTVVLPSLVINYFGQGALVLGRPEDIEHPFYHLAPDWATYPLVLLATLATVIASQAVISGAFSLTRQAVQLDQLPRLNIVQTSSDEIGQIYIPVVNWILMVAAIGLVLGFGSSSNLAAAYGVAITTTMIITTILAGMLAREKWKWGLPIVLAVSAGFLVMDVAFFGAAMLKVVDGGWFPLVIAGAVFVIMTTWSQGRFLVARRLKKTIRPLDELFQWIDEKQPHRVPGTAIFMTGRSDGAPPLLNHHLEHNQVLHERVVLLTVMTTDVPHVPWANRLECEELDHGFYRLIMHTGFMDSPDVPKALRLAKHEGLEIDPEKITYYVGQYSLVATRKIPGMAIWRERLFSLMSRTATRPVSFFNVPAERVVEMGLRLEI